MVAADEDVGASICSRRRPAMPDIALRATPAFSAFRATAAFAAHRFRQPVTRYNSQQSIAYRLPISALLLWPEQYRQRAYILQNTHRWPPFRAANKGYRAPRSHGAFREICDGARLQNSTSHDALADASRLTFPHFSYHTFRHIFALFMLSAATCNGLSIVASSRRR